MQEKNLSIVIPVYNEEKRIGKTLFELKNFCDEKELNVEVIVVDDGSTDMTSWILDRFKSFIKVITAWPNKGKGYAVRSGMLAASGKFVLFMDADLATPLSEIEKILKLGGKYDVVIGEREKSGKVKRTIFRSIIGKIFHLISNLLVPMSLRDTQCGFKLFTNSAAKILFGRAKIDRMAFDVEILHLAQK